MPDSLNRYIMVWCILLVITFDVVTSLSLHSLKHDRNSTNVAVTHLTHHKEVIEHQELKLRCKVTISDKSLVVVNWIFAGDHGRHHIIATGDKVHLDRPGIKAQVEPMWDAVDDVEIEEHFLTIDEANIGDQGVYICQIKSADSQNVLASKHTLISVAPRHSIQTSTLESNGDNSDSDPSQPTLGPVTETFMVAAMGKNITLVCRDGDGQWVYWKKHGDPTFRHHGQKLPLIKVDRWDSGVYYCTTNNTRSSVTLRVDLPPKVTLTEFKEGRARQALGHPAEFQCKVEAIPVARISWYHSVPATEGDPKVPMANQRQIHSGDHYHISLDSFKDGYMESKLIVSKVRAVDYGKFHCKAENNIGANEADIELVESNEPKDFKDLIVTPLPVSTSTTSQSLASHSIPNQLYLVLFTIVSLYNVYQFPCI